MTAVTGADASPGGERVPVLAPCNGIMEFMRAGVSFAPLAGSGTSLLAVLAIDTQTEKGPEAKPTPTLLTTDAAVQAAAANVLSTGEYKGGANETVLLHAPAGLATKRLLIVG